MVNPLYSAIQRRRRRIIEDSSSDENTPPNVLSGCEKASRKLASSSSGTASVASPWKSLELWMSSSKQEQSSHTPSPPARALPLQCRSPTTSSPVLVKTPPRRLETTKKLDSRRAGRRERLAAAAPYARARPAQRASYRLDRPHATSPVERLHSFLRVPAPDDVFEPARWPLDIIHLRESFNPLATVFPFVPNYGWCGCSSECRVDSCPNSLVNLYCNVNNCPYDGLCGNGLGESSKVFLAKNARTKTLGVVAAEDIRPGEVVGQYLGEIEHLHPSRSKWPRNQGYRLVLNQRPERPSTSVRVAINAQRMGGLMRFVNHSCRPVAKFVEVSNGRRTTVVVATTHIVRRGEEVTVDYGDDLWFVCRCGWKGCLHRDIQDDEDP